MYVQMAKCLPQDEPWCLRTKRVPPATRTAPETSPARRYKPQTQGHRLVTATCITDTCSVATDRKIEA